MNLFTKQKIDSDLEGRLWLKGGEGEGKGKLGGWD